MPTICCPQAVELFNRQPRALALALKPCCLPGPGFEQQHGKTWTLGGRSFATADVVVHGTWNGAQGGWHGGPPKRHQGKKFAAWVAALHGGVQPGPDGHAEAARVQMREEEWHYQDAFIFAQRGRGGSAPGAVPREDLCREADGADAESGELGLCGRAEYSAVEDSPGEDAGAGSLRTEM